MFNKNITPFYLKINQLSFGSILSISIIDMYKITKNGIRGTQTIKQYNIIKSTHNKTTEVRNTYIGNFTRNSIPPHFQAFFFQTGHIAILRTCASFLEQRN